MCTGVKHIILTIAFRIGTDSYESVRVVASPRRAVAAKLMMANKLNDSVLGFPFQIHVYPPVSICEDQRLCIRMTSVNEEKMDSNCGIGSNCNKVKEVSIQT